MESKSLFASKTFWALVAAAAGIAAKRFGFSLDEAGLTNDLFTCAALVAAMWARFAATQPLHVVPGSQLTATERSFWVFAPLLVLACLVVSCAGTAVDTKNKAQALTYYSLGQAYEGIDGAFNREEISGPVAWKLTLQVDLASALLDLSRSPASKTVQDSLQKTSDLLDALGALKPSDKATVQAALNVAKVAMAGGAFPDSNDTASWLLLSSNLLRTVSAATAKRA